MRVTRRSVLAGGASIALASRLVAAEFRPVPQPDPTFWHIDDEPTITGQAPGPNGGVYYRLYGQTGRTPVIALHGGPAAGELYMRPYVGLASDRQVVLYDQSGCGKSARPTNLSLYTVERYVEELEALRRHLAFDRVILIGHSWGGFLGPAYAARYPQHVAGLVLAGSAARWRDFQDAAQRWLAELGPDAVATAQRGGDDPAYGALLANYYARHFCRLDPYPDWFVKLGEEVGRNPVYTYLNGPSEFQFSGAFAGLDNSAILTRLRTPTLITCGEYDEAPAWVAARLKKLVRRSKVAVFPGLSHMAHVEDPAQVIGATAAFLNAAKL